MHSTVSSLPGNESWRELCEAALREPDSIKLVYRIVNAECAIHQRLTQLLTDAGDHVEEEEALNDAAYAMRALRSTLRLPTTTAVASDSQRQKMA